MFQTHDESSHPFSHYKKGQPQSYGNSHYLRIYPNVLWVMKNLGEESFTAKRQVYNQHGVQEYEMGVREIKEFEEHLEKNKAVQKQREEKLIKLKAPLADAKSVDFKSSEAVTVSQHEYAVTKGTSNQPVLGTIGAGPCVILALYDSENKVAVLAHIDAITDTDSLSSLFNLISKYNTVAHLFGGDHSSQDQCMDIVEVLERNNIKIVNSDIVRDSFESASLAIDSRTGVIYAPVKHTQLNKTPGLDMRLQFAGLRFGNSPLKQCYNGLQVTASLQPILTVVPKKLSIEKESKADNLLPLTLGFLSVKKKQRKGKNQPCSPANLLRF